MKKIIPLCAVTLVLSGCIWEGVEGSGAAGKPFDSPMAYKPKYEYESYTAYRPDAVEKMAINDDLEYYKNQVSYKVQNTFNQSIQKIKKNNPGLFKTHKSFLVGAFVNVDNINKSEKAGRITAMGMTDIIGKTAEAKYIRFKRDMITVNNKMIVPTQEATKAAAAFKTDAIVMGVYRVNTNSISIKYAIYDAKTRAYLGEDNISVPIDRTTAKFAYEI